MRERHREGTGDVLYFEMGSRYGLVLVLCLKYTYVFHIMFYAWDILEFFRLGRLCGFQFF